MARFSSKPGTPVVPVIPTTKETGVGGSKFETSVGDSEILCPNKQTNK